jgi:hypothetical protein
MHLISMLPSKSKWIAVNQHFRSGVMMTISRQSSETIFAHVDK